MQKLFNVLFGMFIAATVALVSVAVVCGDLTK